MWIALCDDDSIQLDILRSKVTGCEILKYDELTVDSFLSGADLLNSALNGKRYDFLFLDIHMPEPTGFEVFKELTTIEGYGESAFIFVSTHLERLPEVFCLGVHGFLAKPYTQDTFDRTVKSVIAQKAQAKYFTFSQDGIKKTISCDNILYFQTNSYITTMRTVNAEEVNINRRSLSKIECDLNDYGFFRCNRSMLVNLRHCSYREGSKLSVKHSNVPIKLSRQKLKSFDKRLVHFKMGDF